MEMARPALSSFKIPTDSPQLCGGDVVSLAAATASRRRARASSSPANDSARVSGAPREATRGSGRVVVEVGGGITVYPARGAGDQRPGSARHAPGERHGATVTSLNWAGYQPPAQIPAIPLRQAVSLTGARTSGAPLMPGVSALPFTFRDRRADCRCRARPPVPEARTRGCIPYMFSQLLDQFDNSAESAGTRDPSLRGR